MDPRDYVVGLEVDTPDVIGDYVQRTRGAGAGSAAPEGVVNLGALVTFVSGLDDQQRSDVLDSVQLAQRAADARHDRFAETGNWYSVYTEVMKGVGWVTQQDVSVVHRQQEGKVSINQEALTLLAAIASQNALGILSSALDTLKEMRDDSGIIQLFKFNSLAGSSGNIQIGVAERDIGGAVNLAMGAFHFSSEDQSGGFIFALFGRKEVQFWASAQKMTLDASIYARARNAVAEKLGSPDDFISSLGPLKSRII